MNDLEKRIEVLENIIGHMTCTECEQCFWGALNSIKIHTQTYVPRIVCSECFEKRK